MERDLLSRRGSEGESWAGKHRQRFTDLSKGESWISEVRSQRRKGYARSILVTLAYLALVVVCTSAVASLALALDGQEVNKMASIAYAGGGALTWILINRLLEAVKGYLEASREMPR